MESIAVRIQCPVASPSGLERKFVPLFHFYFQPHWGGTKINSLYRFYKGHMSPSRVMGTQKASREPVVPSSVFLLNKHKFQSLLRMESLIGSLSPENRKQAETNPWAGGFEEHKNSISIGTTPPRVFTEKLRGTLGLSIKDA